MGSKSIIVTEILPRIFHLKFRSLQDAAAAFIRFHGYYESPNPRFRGHCFTVEQYRKWYTRKTGNDFYDDVWSGFNIPGYVLKPFRDGKFDPLSALEKELLSALASVDRRKPFYVIGTASKKYLRHEMMHALWYMNKSYRRESSTLLKQIPESFRAQFKTELLNTGYCSEVVNDELQAYLLCGKWWFKDHGLDIAPYANIIEELSDVFERYSKP